MTQSGTQISYSPRANVGVQIQKTQAQPIQIQPLAPTADVSGANKSARIANQIVQSLFGTANLVGQAGQLSAMDRQKKERAQLLQEGEGARVAANMQTKLVLPIANGQYDSLIQTIDLPDDVAGPRVSFEDIAKDSLKPFTSQLQDEAAQRGFEQAGIKTLLPAIEKRYSILRAEQIDTVNNAAISLAISQPEKMNNSIADAIKINKSYGIRKEDTLRKIMPAILSKAIENRDENLFNKAIKQIKGESFTLARMEAQRKFDNAKYEATQFQNKQAIESVDNTYVTHGIEAALSKIDTLAKDGTIDPAQQVQMKDKLNKDYNGKVYDELDRQITTRPDQSITQYTATLQEQVKAKRLSTAQKDSLLARKSKGAKNKIIQELVYDVSHGTESYQKAKAQVDKRQKLWRENNDNPEGLSPSDTRQLINEWQQQTRTQLDQDFIGNRISPEEYAGKLVERSQLGQDDPLFVDPNYAMGKINTLTRQVETDIQSELVQRVMAGQNSTDPNIKGHIILTPGADKAIAKALVQTGVLNGVADGNNAVVSGVKNPIGLAFAVDKFQRVPKAAIDLISSGLSSSNLQDAQAVAPALVAIAMQNPDMAEQIIGQLDDQSALQARYLLARTQEQPFTFKQPTDAKDSGAVADAMDQNNQQISDLANKWIQQARNLKFTNETQEQVQSILWRGRSGYTGSQVKAQINSQREARRQVRKLLGIDTEIDTNMANDYADLVEQEYRFAHATGMSEKQAAEQAKTLAARRFIMDHRPIDIYGKTYLSNAKGQEPPTEETILKDLSDYIKQSREQSNGQFTPNPPYISEALSQVPDPENASSVGEAYLKLDSMKIKWIDDQRAWVLYDEITGRNLDLGTGQFQSNGKEHYEYMSQQSQMDQIEKMRRQLRKKKEATEAGMAAQRASALIVF